MGQFEHLLNNPGSALGYKYCLSDAWGDQRRGRLNVDKGQKLAKFCRCLLWMAPNTYSHIFKLKAAVP